MANVMLIIVKVLLFVIKSPLKLSKLSMILNGANVSIRIGPAGNYAYLRFAAQIDVPPIFGRATNATVKLGGLEGRALRAGDELDLIPLSGPEREPVRRGQPDPDARRGRCGARGVGAVHAARSGGGSGRAGARADGGGV